MHIESKVWQKVKVDGDLLIGRGAHTLAAVDDLVVLYGGSAEFRPNLGHCAQYFNDVYVMKTGGLLSFFRFNHPFTLRFFVMCHYITTSEVTSL